MNEPAAPPLSQPGSAGPPPQVPDLEPNLRRFVVAYASRRADLNSLRRWQLAAGMESSLRQSVPQLVERLGPAGALDYLADREGGALLPKHPDASRGFGFGIAGLVTAIFCAPVGVVCSGLALLFSGRALAAIRREPGRYSGREDARHGRTMAIIGLAVAAVFLGIFALSYVPALLR
jgi:hypothetical protein